MKKMTDAIIISNDEIAPGIFSMWLEAPYIAQTAKAGQFVELYVNDGAHLLPRPISICDANQEALRIVYQVVGKGTAWFSRLKVNQPIRVTGALGNGFTLGGDKTQILVGGGVGIPPMLYLCKQIKANNPECKPAVFLGFRTGGFLIEDFEKLGVTVKVSTDDGSKDFHGNVVALMEKENVSRGDIYACGPKIMLENTAKYAENHGMACQVSMEEKMACGIGACVGCVVKIKDETCAEGWIYKKVCLDGPVFNGREVLWHD